MTADPGTVTFKEHMDARLAAQLRLGAAALVGVIACGWIGFSMNAKATALALDSERRATKAALDANNREVEAHNGTIREWEKNMATKDEIRPLQKEHERRQGGVVAGAKWVGWIALAAMVGFGLANLPPLRGTQPVTVENHPTDPVPVEPAARVRP